MANTLSAGLAWVFHLTFMGWENSMPISKLQWWLWVLYLTIGAGAIVVYRDSTVQFLLASYFCIYALMGFLWHCRELHVATLWAATPDQEDSTSTNHSTTESSATCPGYAPKLKAKRCAARPEKLMTVKRVTVVHMCVTLLYIIVRAWLLYTCEEGDRLVCLFRLLYAIMLAVHHEREVELGRFESKGGGEPQQKSQEEGMPGSATSEQATDTAVGAEDRHLERVLTLDQFGWGGATMLTKIIFWLHRQYFFIIFATLILYWDLPREQWLYTLQAVLYAWFGSLCFQYEIIYLQPRGDGFY